MPELVDQPLPESLAEACMRFDHPIVRVPADLYTCWCEDTLKELKMDSSTIPQKQLNEMLALFWTVDLTAGIDSFKTNLKERYQREVKGNWNFFVWLALRAHDDGGFEEGSDEDYAREFLLPDDFEIYFERYVKPSFTSTPIDGPSPELAGQAFLEATFTIPTRSPQGILNLNDTWAGISDQEKMVLDFRGRVYQDVLRMEDMLRQRAAKGPNQSGAPPLGLEGARNHGLHVDELFSFLPGTSYARYTPTWPPIVIDQANEFLNTLENLGTSSLEDLLGLLLPDYLKTYGITAALLFLCKFRHTLCLITDDTRALYPDLLGTLDSAELTGGASMRETLPELSLSRLLLDENHVVQLIGAASM